MTQGWDGRDRGMQRIGSESLAGYMVQDWVAAALHDATLSGDDELTCQKWLMETPAKRFAFSILYGDLVREGGRRILDIDGGLSSLTRLLAGRNSYELIDLLAHDNPSLVQRFVASAPAFKLVRDDWYEVSPRGIYDVVTAADLFPNVDQRLALFLERMLPITREIRLSLTIYNQPRFYMTRRIGADEIFCMLAWNGQQAKAALRPFVDRIVQPKLELLDIADDSVYSNGRQVCLITLKGGV